MIDIVRIYSDSHGLFIRPRCGNLNIYRPQRSKLTRPTIKQLTVGFVSDLKVDQYVRVRHASPSSSTIELALLNSSYAEVWCSHGPYVMDKRDIASVDVWKPFEEVPRKEPKHSGSSALYQALLAAEEQLFLFTRVHNFDRPAAGETREAVWGALNQVRNMMKTLEETTDDSSDTEKRSETG